MPQARPRCPGPRNATTTMDIATDLHLVELARRGDREAEDRLLRRHLPRIHTICRRIACNPEDALDAAQEALIAIHRSLPGFDGRSAFETWMYRVTTNAALGEMRRRARRSAVLLTDDHETLLAGSETQDRRETFSSAVVDRLDIDEALSTLAPDFRAAVVLRDLCDLDYPRIAEVLGIAEGTVRSRIHRGRRALHKALCAQQTVQSA